jgi:hypothetical protein
MKIWQVYCECGIHFAPTMIHVEASPVLSLVCQNCQTRYGLEKAKAMIQKGFWKDVGENDPARMVYQMPDTRLTT